MKTFISYHRHSSASLAHAIKDGLHQRGIDSFLDVRDLEDKLGLFPEELTKQIRDADVFVCLLGEKTLQSPWVKQEILTAFDLNKPMIPIIQEDFIGITESNENHVTYLLNSNGIPILDKRGLYIPEAIDKLAVLINGFSKSARQVEGFTLITEQFFEETRTFSKATNGTYFYDGARPSWSDILFERDVPRDKLQDVLTEIKNNRIGFRLLPITASGGSGKSTFLMRLVYNLVFAGEIVFYHKHDALTLNSESIIRSINQIRNNQVILAIDDGTRIKNLAEFIHVLAEHEINLLLVFTTRSFEWAFNQINFVDNLSIVRPSSKNYFNLDTVSNEEIKRIFDKFTALGKMALIPSERLEEATDYYAVKSKRSILALMLFINKGERISDVIKDESQRLLRLSPVHFAAYRYICILNAMGSYGTRQLIAEICDSEDLAIDLVRFLPGLIEEDDHKIFARHDLLAELVVKGQFENDSTGFLIAFERLVTLALKQGEKEIIRRLYPIKKFATENQQQIISHILKAQYRICNPSDTIKFLYDLAFDKDIPQETIATTLISNLIIIIQLIIRIMNVKLKTQLTIKFNDLASIQEINTLPDHLPQDEKFTDKHIDEALDKITYIYSDYVNENKVNSEIICAIGDIIFDILNNLIPDNFYVHYYWGKYHLDMYWSGSESIATDALNKAVTINPESIEANCLLCVAAYRTSNWKLASSSFDRAYKLNPERIIANRNLDLYSDWILEYLEESERIADWLHLRAIQITDTRKVMVGFEKAVQNLYKEQYKYNLNLPYDLQKEDKIVVDYRKSQEEIDKMHKDISADDLIQFSQWVRQQPKKVKKQIADSVWEKRTK